MTPLTVEIVKLLAVETLTAESISRILWVTGHGMTSEPIPVETIEAALAELMAAGQVERVHSARLGPRYRALRTAHYRVMHKPALVSEQNMRHGGGSTNGSQRADARTGESGLERRRASR